MKGSVEEMDFEIDKLYSGFTGQINTKQRKRFTIFLVGHKNRQCIRN